MAGRTLRSGKFFSPFVLDDAIIVPSVRIGDLIARHAVGPQDSDSDDEGGVEDDDGSPAGDDDDTKPCPTHPLPTPPPTCVPSKARFSKGDTPLLAAARLHWKTQISQPPHAAEGSSTSSAPKKSKRERKVDRHRAARAAKREALREVPGAPKAPKALVLLRAREASPFAIDFSLATGCHSVASTGWMGLRSPPALPFEPENRAYGLEEAKAIPGMTLCDFTGKTGPIVDADRHVIGVYDAGPRDPKWAADVVAPATALMEEAAAGIYEHVFSGVYYGTRKQEKKRRKNGGVPTPLDAKMPRRGDFNSKTIGNSMGGGQEAPSPFFHIVLNRIVLAGLLATQPFQRLAGHTNTIFQAYAPDLHRYYGTTLERLHTWNKKLKRNFLSTISVFAAATFNFGPATVTLPHLDFANLAWGWCAITAFGHFDPDRGGHLILWDLMLIIRFPPGATIFLPSALLRHSNVAIQQGEKRYSFTQFTSAGIFRFVENGFRSDREVNEGSLSGGGEGGAGQD
ncbi:hypothetical protein C8F04DRAFT_1279588 [Mycena alexandri]|uniref:Uncharacterized protein n=1 Tax=Mycena alexandri TaxID=1745969 RepID=A0AAD6RXZ2_9AGAR|nr:hypothetical protein C8F04DRAFT_1279588 [Mycena alexandri]